MSDYDNAGQHIIYVDKHGIERDALVTCWHGSSPAGAVVPVRCETSCTLGYNTPVAQESA